jgi:hypothetical protein
VGIVQITPWRFDHWDHSAEMRCEDYEHTCTSQSQSVLLDGEFAIKDCDELLPKTVHWRRKHPFELLGDEEK